MGVVRQFGIRGVSPAASPSCDTSAISNRLKRPADFAQRAKLIIGIATGQTPPDPPFTPESARAKNRAQGRAQGWESLREGA